MNERKRLWRTIAPIIAGASVAVMATLITVAATRDDKPDQTTVFYSSTRGPGKTPTNSPGYMDPSRPPSDYVDHTYDHWSPNP